MELSFTPRWIVGREPIDRIIKEGTKRHSLFCFMLRTDIKSGRLRKYWVHFGAKYYNVEKYRRDGPDILCPKFVIRNTLHMSVQL